MPLEERKAIANKIDTVIYLIERRQKSVEGTIVEVKQLLTTLALMLSILNVFIVTIATYTNESIPSLGLFALLMFVTLVLLLFIYYGVVNPYIRYITHFSLLYLLLADLKMCLIDENCQIDSCYLVERIVEIRVEICKRIIKGWVIGPENICDLKISLMKYYFAPFKKYGVTAFKMEQLLSPKYKIKGPFVELTRLPVDIDIIERVYDIIQPLKEECMSVKERENHQNNRVAEN